jgi:phage-related protein
MFEEIKNFIVKVAIKEDKSSQVIDYIYDLIQSNPVMANKAILNIKNLPFKIYSNQDVKPIIHPKAKLFELKVQSKSSICRFFFVVERPNVIILYGFTKKTQKTDKKDINAGVNAFEEYKNNKKSIPFDIL